MGAMKHELVRGLRGAGQTRIRVMRDDDSDVVNRLIMMTMDAALPPDHLYFHYKDYMSSAVLQGSREDFLSALSGQEVDIAWVACSIILVAEHAEYGVVGLVLASPPGKDIFGLMDRGGFLSVERAQALLVGVVKISAVAVIPEFQGRGIGASLVKKARELYAELGYVLLYGECPDLPELRSFYEARGCDVQGPMDGLDLSPLLDLGHHQYVLIAGDPREVLFTRVLNLDYPFPTLARNVRDISKFAVLKPGEFEKEDQQNGLLKRMRNIVTRRD